MFLNASFVHIMVMVRWNQLREKKEINVEIGQRIKFAREAATLTQDELAELVGLDSKNVSAIERGVSGISISTLKKISSVLSISSDFLLFGSDSSLNDLSIMTERLKHLSPRQFKITLQIMNAVIKSFTTSEE